MGHSHQSNIEALLRIAESEGEEQIVVSDLSLLFSEYKIDKGNVAVYTNTVYKLYCHWATTPMPKPQFIEELSSLMEIKGNKVFLNKQIKEYLPYVKTKKIEEKISAYRKQMQEWRDKDEKKRKRQFEYKKSTYL